MDKIVAKVPRRISTTRTVEWILAVFSLIGGVYPFSPLYVPILPNAYGLGALLSHSLMIQTWAAVMATGAILIILGLLRNTPQFKSLGWFLVAMTRLYQVLTVWIVIGFIPFTAWLLPLTVTCLSIALWASARWEINSE